MVLRNPPIGTECRECGHPAGHNLGCRTAHKEDIDKIAKLQEALGQWVDIYEGRCDDNLTDGERRLEAWTASIKLLPSNNIKFEDGK